MLDTNTVSNLIKKHPFVARRLAAVPIASLCIAAITEAPLDLRIAAHALGVGAVLGTGDRVFHVRSKVIALFLKDLPENTEKSQLSGNVAPTAVD